MATEEIAAASRRIRQALEQLEASAPAERELFDTAATLQRLIGELAASAELPDVEADETFIRAGRLVGTLLHTARRGVR